MSLNAPVNSCAAAPLAISVVYNTLNPTELLWPAGKFYIYIFCGISHIHNSQGKLYAAIAVCVMVHPHTRTPLPQWLTRKLTPGLNCPLTAASSRPSGRRCATGRPAGSHTTTLPFVEKKIPRVALISRFLAVQWGPPVHRSHLRLSDDKPILNRTSLEPFLSLSFPNILHTVTEAAASPH